MEQWNEIRRRILVEVEIKKARKAKAKAEHEREKGKERRVIKVDPVVRPGLREVKL